MVHCFHDNEEIDNLLISEFVAGNTNSVPIKARQKINLFFTAEQLRFLILNKHSIPREVCAEAQRRLAVRDYPCHVCGKSHVNNNNLMSCFNCGRNIHVECGQQVTLGNTTAFVCNRCRCR